MLVKMNDVYDKLTEIFPKFIETMRDVWEWMISPITLQFRNIQYEVAFAPLEVFLGGGLIFFLGYAIFKFLNPIA